MSLIEGLLDIVLLPNKVPYECLSIDEPYTDKRGTVGPFLYYIETTEVPSYSNTQSEELEQP